MVGAEGRREIGGQGHVGSQGHDKVWFGVPCAMGVT